jgi:hypothetical protein
MTWYFLLSLLAVDGGTLQTVADNQAHQGDLVTTLLPEGRWCGGRAQFRMTVTNLADSTIWLGLAKPSLGSIDWISYFYSPKGLVGSEVRDGTGCGGDPLAFIRSSDATKLLPGKSRTWRVRVGPLSLRAGPADIEVWARINRTQDLSSDSLQEIELRAAIPIVLSRDDACFKVRRRLTRR